MPRCLATDFSASLRGSPVFRISSSRCCRRESGQPVVTGADSPRSITSVISPRIADAHAKAPEAPAECRGAVPRGPWLTPAQCWLAELQGLRPYLPVKIDPVRRLVQDQSRGETGQFFQSALSKGSTRREKTGKEKTLGGKTGAHERGNSGRWSGYRNDLNSFFSAGRNKFIAGIRNQRRAGITDQSNAFAFAQHAG